MSWSGVYTHKPTNGAAVMDSIGRILGPSRSRPTRVSGSSRNSDACSNTTSTSSVRARIDPAKKLPADHGTQNRYIDITDHCAANLRSKCSTQVMPITVIRE